MVTQPDGQHQPTNGAHNRTTPDDDLDALMEEETPRSWEESTLDQQQAWMLTYFTPAEWLTNKGLVVGAVLRHDDRAWYPWKALAKERGVDTYGYEKAVDKLLQDLRGPQGSPPATAARPHAIRITARALKAEVLPPLHFVVEDILPAGCTLLTGKSKDGKSMLAYNLTVAVASGGLALGHYPTMAGSVWYLALEDGKRRAQTRLALQEAQMGPLSDAAQDRLAFTLWDAPRLGAGLEEDIREWITTAPDARLVILDILEKVRPPRKLGGSTYAEDYAATSSLTRLAEEQNVAILILHHSNKSNTIDFRDSASGAMSLVGGADNFWSLARQPLSAEATLKVTGRDLPREYDLAMRFQDGYWTALGETRLVVMSQERQAIVAALRASPRPLTPTHVAAAVGKKPATITMTLRKMLDTGVVMQPTEGHYALSPSYLSTNVDSIDSVDSIDPVDSVDSPPCRGAESTGVNAESTPTEKTQPVEKQKQSGARLNESTESMGSTPLAHFSPPDCLPPPCPHCRGTIFWTGATGQMICVRCHPQPTHERST
jgi:hypothetical protein